MDSSESTPRPQKLFTLHEANASLPLVRAIAQDLSDLSKKVLERRERIQLLKQGREYPPGDLYGDELNQVEVELEQEIAQLREYVDELRSLGVELKSAPDGLLDFPSLHDGRIVYLCWRLGEPEVQHWHELDAGFAGRQPVELLGGPVQSAGRS